MWQIFMYFQDQGILKDTNSLGPSLFAPLLSFMKIEGSVALISYAASIRFHNFL